MESFYGILKQGLKLKEGWFVNFFSPPLLYIGIIDVCHTTVVHGWGGESSGVGYITQSTFVSSYRSASIEYMTTIGF